MLLSLTEDEIKGSKIDSKLLIETAADCVGQENTLLTVKTSQPKSCKKVSTSIEQTPVGPDRTQYSAVFKISNSSCNTWWYALIGAVGGVALIAGALALLFTLNTTLRQKCRPYAK
jgi:hypothetical protein